MGFQSKDIKFFVLIVFVSIGVSVVLAQPSTQGFISLDCGVSNNQSYTDTRTNLIYNSDYEFIGAGTSYNIAANFLNSSLSKQYETVRSFPNGSRNCYTLQPAVQGQRYLIRAGFIYANYDGLNSKSIKFDLYLGVNIWKTIEIIDASSQYTAEIITLALADFVFVCLVNTGLGTPIISLLEMRPLKESIYKFANASQSLNLFQRFYMGPSIIRYPLDQYDRKWDTFGSKQDWSITSTDKTISNYNNDDFEASSSALQFAAAPTTGMTLNFSWGDGNKNTEYFFVFYFSELIDVLNMGMLRMFSIYYNSYMDPWVDPFSPPYLYGYYFYANGFFTDLPYHNFSLQATSNSTLPPIINAIEIYTRVVPTQAVTDLKDVGAMNGIREDYQVKKNWMGDPCSPVQFAWDGLKCISSTNVTMVTRLDLSYSELTGMISNSFASLKFLQFLDLSYNNLSGKIPDSLGNMTSLNVLNLTGNNFTGPVPDSLVKRENAGLLILVMDSYKTSCGNSNSCPSNNKKITTSIIIIIVAVSCLILVLLAIIIVCVIILLRKSPGRAISRGSSMQPLRIESFSRHDLGPTQNNGLTQNTNLDLETENLKFEGRKFTYKQLENLTNNFIREIGKGGFGVVYHGKLENGTEIAVKMSSSSSLQGRHEFFAEVQSLTRVHHKNLVYLIGYCTDVGHLALVFEYMSLGSLKDHLAGRTSFARVLTWKERLQIAFEAAKGLDYLHAGCEIIHRDVKSSNILLGQNLEAKLSDFGLSKVSGQSEQDSHHSIGIVGTPGYIDPESSTTLSLTYKSDVYSFGVILLEMLTGEPPTKSANGGSHIANCVVSRLSGGDINEIMDSKFNAEYNLKSAWKVVDLAMQCVAVSSSRRPIMNEVVFRLKECLDVEGIGNRFSGISEKNGASSSGVRNQLGKSVHVTFAPLER